MLKCKEFTKEVGESLNGNWKTNWQYVLHFSICSCCRSYVDQLTKIKFKIKEYYAFKKVTVDSNQIKNLETKVIDQILKK